ncbi:MAG: alpha/beta hydrolase-fold protein [Aureliella sp.]
MKQSTNFVLALCLLVPASGFSLAQEAGKPTRRSPQPEIRYPHGEDSEPQEGVPKGKLEGPFLLHSDIIEDTTRKYWVYVPAQYTGEKPANLLVFQDGARAIGNTIAAPQVLDNLIAKKQIPVTIGIFITPGNRGDEYPDSIGTQNPDNRDREYDVLNDLYARMVIEEILPEVGKKYSISVDPKDRAIGGSSSGAICAFTVAWERPEAFGNVVSFIGSFTNIHGGHVYPELVRSADKKPIRIFLQDGINDLRSPNNLERDWHLQNQKMVAAFEEKGYDMAHVFGEGGHSDDHGAAMLPQMLRWIWRDHPDVEPTTDDLVAQAAAIKPNSSEAFSGFNADAKVDPSGLFAWETRNTPNSLTITLKDGKIQGTHRSERPGQGLVETEIANAELEGNKLIFDLTTKFGDREVTSNFQGIVSEAGINGWRMMEFGGQFRDTPWLAKRVPEAPLLKKVNDTASWQFETTGSGEGTMEVEGDAIVFKTSKLSSQNWHVQAYQSGIDLTEGAEYQLRIKASSPEGKSVLVMGIINEEDWHGIGLQQEISVGKAEREHVVTFTASDVKANNNRIGFVLGDTEGTVKITAITLTKSK